VGHACWTTRRLRPEGCPPIRTAWVDAVTIAPAYQRQGIGTAVMRRLAEETGGFQLRALGTEQMTFFERLGWERWHGPTEGVLHDPLDCLMVRPTVTTPALDTSGPIAAV
jgi:aminoglycoside 2'-N-acetyltransferase I